MSEMLAPALFYHDEGLCVIPIAPRDKRPALPTWEEYQVRRSTRSEVEGWFSNGSRYNIGIIHGEVSGNYIAIDIDHDNGIFQTILEGFPKLGQGRIEQSGSRQGWHIPFRVECLPDFGTDSKHDRPRGNRTWKTELGDVNIRCRYCQTVAPPSIHPTGNRYRFERKGQLIALPNIDGLITWLNKLAPPPLKSLPAQQSRPAIQPTDGDDLLTAVKDYWQTALQVFEHFGIVTATREDRDGEIRVLGNGGLLIHADNPALWYNFSDEFGGDTLDAWGWLRFGSSYDKSRQFRQVLVEMAQAAGIDVAKFYRRGDETRTAAAPAKDTWHWTNQRPVFARLR